MTVTTLISKRHDLQLQHLLTSLYLETVDFPDPGNPDICRKNKLNPLPHFHLLILIFASSKTPIKVSLYLYNNYKFNNRYTFSFYIKTQKEPLLISREFPLQLMQLLPSSSFYFFFSLL